MFRSDARWDFFVSHLEDVGNDVPLALLEEGILVEIRIHLQDLSQNLRHLGFGE